MGNILSGSNASGGGLSPEQKRELFIAVLIPATGAFNQMNQLKQLSSLQHQQYESKMSGIIDQANSLGMNIDPTRYL